MFQRAWTGGWILWLVACGAGGTPIRDQMVTVACGMCLFEMEEYKGCFWAAEIDGEHYVIQGDLPEDHDGHAPDGMCNARRTAKITGEILDDRLIARSFDLLPFEGSPPPPAAAHQHVH